MMAKINSSRYQRNCAYNACDWSCPIRAGAVTPVEAPVSAEGDCNGTNVRAFDGVGCADDCAGSVADLPPRSVHARRRSTLLRQRESQIAQEQKQVMLRMNQVRPFVNILGASSGLLVL